MTGCSLIFEDPDTPCPVADDDSEYLNLSFRMMVPVDDKSRVDDNHDEIDSENPSLEDHIYSDDFCFFIYAGSQNDLDPAFIKKVYNGSGENDPNTMIWGGPIEYIVKVAVPKSDFESKVPGEGDVVFRVVAIANSEKVFSMLTPAQYDTYSHLIESASKWNFNIFGTLYTQAGTLVSAPRIPMYGMASYNVARDRLYRSTSADPVYGDENISLLRSLAKIKVIDNIAGRDAQGFPYVESVTFHTKSTAYTLPYDAINYKNGYQVETARPYTDESGLKELTLQSNSTGNVWTGYVPEQIINTQDKTAVPLFRIKVARMKDKDGNVLFSEYDVPMSSYNGLSFGFGSNILRNHIYTLSIEQVEASLALDLEVLPWIREDSYIDFSSNVGVSSDGVLSINGGAYLNKQAARLVVEYPDVAHGTFYISTPENCRWDAYLITKTGVLNAIQFKMADGTYTNTISGIVGVDKAEFDITASIQPGNTANTAELVVLVTLADGTSVPAEILDPAWGSSSKTLTIIQNPQ